MNAHPVVIQKIGSELAIAWSDGTESFLPLEMLRRHCPCATCAGEPDVMGHVQVPHGKSAAPSFDLVSWQVVGGYAIQPRWADGHSTGLFSYALLRRLPPRT